MGILHSNVKVQVPLSQIRYDEDEFSFNWKNVWVSAPYGEKVLKKKDASILQDFKDNLKDDITIKFRWHRIRQLAEEIVILYDTEVIERIDEVVKRARTLLSTLEERLASGTLTMKEAEQIMAKSKLKSGKKIIRLTLGNIVHRMPEQQIKIELHFPLSQLIYDPHSFRFKWNEIWLAVPYKQQDLKIKNSRFLEIFKDILKSEIKINVFWNRVFQKIDAVNIEMSPANTKELSDILSHVETCVEKIRALVKERELSLEKAKDILAAEGLQCPDDEIHQILTTIVDEMALQREPVTFPISLKDIEYGPSEFIFHYDGKSFRLNNSKLPFETGPILQEIKGQLSGDLTFHMDIGCLVKWDRKNKELLVGELSTGVKEIKDKVEIIQETLDNFEVLRAGLICDAINEIDKNTLSLGDVETILKKWGLDLKNRKIGERIENTIPKWLKERSFSVPAKEVEYFSSGIRIYSNDGPVLIRSKDLPFETSDVLDKIKDIFEGDIQITESRTVGFVWSKTKEQLDIEQGSASYKVEAEDKILERFRCVHVMYKALKIKFPARPEWDIIKIIRESGYVGGLPAGSIAPGYDPQCITILEKKAEYIYMTGIDLWFKIDDVLVWERPEYSAATYVFKWPEQQRSLEDFIAKIWSYELLEHIWRDPSTGYKYRVIHDYDYDLYNWKRTFR
jgi:hypothetical protein